MQFQSESNNQDIVSEIDALCDSTSTSYPINSKTRRVNAALESIVAMILNADGTWDYDDTNHTNLPIGTGDLVADQQSYSFASEYLEIKTIKVKDSNSNWHVLKPIDQSTLVDTAIEELYDQSGMPEYYDKLGDTIKLYPAPSSTDVTLTAGFKVEFARTVDLFVPTDTTQEPGLPSPYHVTLAYMAAIPYCMIYKKDRVVAYQRKVDMDLNELIKFYSRREKDVRKVAVMSNILHR